MAGVLGRRHVTDAGTAVRYTPCAKGEHTDEEELEEIAVVSQRDDDAPPTPARRQTFMAQALRENAGPISTHRRGNSDPEATANGPPALPTTGVSPGRERHGGSLQLTHALSTSSDRTKLIGERLSTNSRISLSSPLYSSRVVEQKSRSTSKTSLLEIFSHKLERNKGRKSRSFSKEEVAYVNKAHISDAMTPKELRKQRRKDIDEKFGKRFTRQQKLDRLESSTAGSTDKDSCKWTFVFDPSGRLAYWWSFVISIAFLYNFWVIIYRFAFEEINSDNIAVWFSLDYFADFLYILDVAFHFRTGYLEDGVLQTDGTKLRIHYMNSTMFYIDCLCLLPLDFLYLSIGFKSMLRCFRLVKIYRFWAFQDRTERHTNYPNTIRTCTLLHYLFAIYHWNACIMFMVTKHLDKEHWNYQAGDEEDMLLVYLRSLYWSTLTLTTIGDLPRPVTKAEHLFVTIEFLAGLLLFATILGHVANIVTNISAARKDFQAKLDSVKTYMNLRRVPLRLQDRVIRWFDYLWLSKKSSDEERTLALLPDKLKAEIALHVHLDTLKRVEIFQNTEAGFLCELVLKLRPVLFSPSDYICRKGEVGKEMYIVNRGRLQVVADNGRTVLATLRPGSYFGEISILNMGNAGNRRTASVRSVGYSDLFCLSKRDLWDVLKDYPTARVRLEAIAVKRLEKYKKPPLPVGKEELAAKVLKRSKSCSGLVESNGKVPLEVMYVSPRYYTSTNKLSPHSSHDNGSHESLRDRDDRSLVSDRHRGSQHLDTQDSGDAAPDTRNQSVDITNSMTVSSLTSYIADSPGIGELQRPASSPPSGPQPASVSHASRRSSPTHGGSPHSHLSRSHGDKLNVFGTFHGDTSASKLSTHAPGTTATAAPPQTHPLIQLQGASPHLLPPPANMDPSNTFPTPAVSPASLAPITSRSSPSPSTGQGHAAHLLASTSNPALAYDPSHDILLQEISRLRDRLQFLETENASMSLKLHQQQWEVQNRLAELELHICGSESGGSVADENAVGNKESVI